jgi:hypothetical protein
MALVVNQVRQSSRPTTRDREKLFREKGVSERLVEEGWGRSGRCPLWLIDVLTCGLDSLPRYLHGEDVHRERILAVETFVSIGCNSK